MFLACASTQKLGVALKQLNKKGNFLMPKPSL